MAGPVDLSIVIPTRNRWPILRVTLDALARQDLSGLRIEVVVVDNGSQDGTHEKLVALRRDDRLPFRLKLERESAPGCYAARNRGIAAASSDLVLLLGDDCRPSHARLVAGHVDAHRAAPAGRLAVLGPAHWDPTLEQTEVMDWLMKTGIQFDYSRLERERPGVWGFYDNNLSIPRRLLLEVSGFDQRFSLSAFGDLDLGLRLFDRGLALDYRADLSAHHVHHYTTASSLRRMEVAGRSANLLHRLHAHRSPLPGPSANPFRLACRRLLAPLMRRPEPPARLPRALRARWLSAVHMAAYARGYAAEPLPDDPVLRGRP